MQRTSALLTLIFGMLIGAAIAYFSYHLGQRPTEGLFSPLQTSPLQTSSLQTSPLQTDAVTAVQRAAPSVVNIKSSRRVERPRSNNLFNLFFNRSNDIQRMYTSLGSAVVINERGYLLTNLHIVRNATDIEVDLGDNESADAYIIGYDEQTDLAVLKIDSPHNLLAISVGTAKDLQIGAPVLAIGNPLGLGKTVTQGIVSATQRHTGNPYAWFIQTDAAINEGNSGGALVDTQGNLLGINSFIITKTGGSDGLGFSIPVDIAMQVASEIIENGKVRRGWVGYLEAVPIPEHLAKNLGLAHGSGLHVHALQHRSALVRAGLKLGDIITHCNDQPATSQLLSSTVYSSKPGDEIKLKLWRNGNAWDTIVNVSEKTNSP